MPNYHYTAYQDGVYYSGAVYFPFFVETMSDYDDIRSVIADNGSPKAGFVLLSLQPLNDPSREVRLRLALQEAVKYLDTAPFNYANGVVSPDGADEGTVKGTKTHNRLLKRLRKVLES